MGHKRGGTWQDTSPACLVEGTSPRAGNLPTFELNFVIPGSCQRVPCHCANGPRLSCHHGNVSLSGETLFKLATHLPGHTIIAEGRFCITAPFGKEVARILRFLGKLSAGVPI